ncbi:MAG: PAS domain S-box protein [Candidatus Anstonellales archaeon]
MNNNFQLQIKLIETLLQQVDAIFWTVDRNLIFTSSLGGGLQKLGLKENQIVGLSLFDYFQTNDINFEPIAKHLEALQGKKAEYFIEWKDRTYHYYLNPLINNDNEIIGVAGIAIDVTKEKNILEELKASEERYKSLFESASDSIFLMKGDIFIDCNPSTLKMFGCQREDIIGQPPYKFSPPFQPDGRTSKEKALDLINRALNGERLAFEWIHSRLDGTTFHAEVRLNRVSIKNENFILAIVRDISEKKDIERQIKLLANALESVNECVSITDLNNRLIYVNKKFSEVYGYKKEELIGKSILILRSDKNNPEITNQIYPETIKGGWIGELWNKRKNGEEFLIRLSTSPVYDEHNKIIALIGVATDITQEKALFNQIKYDAERLKILFENAPDAIFVCDYEGKIIEANKASEALVGYSKDEALGKSFFELNLFDKANFYKAAKVFYKALKTQPTGPDEIVIFNRNGDKLYIEVSTHPIVIEGKKLILCTARDITERKKILLELARAKEEAEKANRQKTLFFASMSHEIRTPINAILGFSEVLKDIFYDKADAEIKNYFEILQNAAKTLLHTISQLLDFSRIESGSFKFQLKEIDIKKEIIDVVELLKMLAEKKALKIETNLPEENVIVKADQYSLNGIISNLLSNAIKYSEKGTISINLWQDNKYAICEIKDEGIGMSDEFQKKLFTQFSREELNKTKKIEGSGLGLALTKKYIDLNKGEISIKSKKGFGTTVTFKIPLAKK